MSWVRRRRVPQRIFYSREAVDKVSPTCIGRGRCHRNVFTSSFRIYHLQGTLYQIKVYRIHTITRFNFLLFFIPRTSPGPRPATMAIRLAASIFVGFALESLLYGVFIVIFLAAAVTQRERWRADKLRAGNKLVMGFSILLLGFISTVSISWMSLNLAFKLG